MKGINIRSDRKNGLRFADLIVDGHKVYETRNSNSLKPWEKQRVGIIRTGEGKAMLIGYATLGRGFKVTQEEFSDLYDQHLVLKGSEFDSDENGKWIYPMKDVERIPEVQVLSKGIIARNLEDHFLQRELQ